MIRKIIHIDEDKCNGCGICATACHEGAIEIVDGKAKLAREHFCDGFGDCLPACPMGAITFEEREAPAYDEAAVMRAKQSSGVAGSAGSVKGSTGNSGIGNGMSGSSLEHADGRSVKLSNWPVQIKLAPIQAPYFDGADLLIAADCTAYAYAKFHSEFIDGRVTLIGCPKLDGVDYSEKLTEIIRNNNIKSVTIVRMEVPCCGGLEWAAKNAMSNSGKHIPSQVITISIDGEILN